jgi:hypothetical protein
VDYDYHATLLKFKYMVLIVSIILLWMADYKGCKKRLVSCVRVASQHLREETEETHEISVTIVDLWSDIRNSELQGRSIKHCHEISKRFRK